MTRLTVGSVTLCLFEVSPISLKFAVASADKLAAAAAMPKRSGLETIHCLSKSRIDL